jgi:hypothetical protein
VSKIVDCSRPLNENERSRSSIEDNGRQGERI